MVEKKFRITDRVFYPYYGRGTVVEVCERDEPYPIRVFWDKPYFEDEPWSSFTRDGVMSLHMIDGDEKFRLKLLKDISKEETGGSEVGQSEKFKVGEHVWSPYFGGGVVTKNEAADNFPIEVHWDDGHLGDYDFFMADGKFNESGTHPEMGIYHIDPEHAAKVLPDIMKELAEDDESTVERMEDALNKKVEDAVNPAHYKVKGLPDAIDIINHLMHREQYEGFLWGNILKYVYRYGRKGDKAETAGKIEWYAKQLKELCEYEAEEKEGEGDKK